MKMSNQKDLSNIISRDEAIKKYIDYALEKANIAVEYDTSNDFQNAICAYTEAVELLSQVLQQADHGHDTDGLKSICNIYKERIDFLSFLKTKGNNNQNNALTVSTTENNKNESSSTSSSKQNTFNSTLLNFFSKKSTKKKKSSHSTLLNFGHHPKENLHHSTIDVQPKASKSAPIFPLEHSKWSKQGRAKNHHLSSDNIITHHYGRRPSSYSSTSQSNASTATLLYFQPYQPLENDTKMNDTISITSASEKNRNYSDNVEVYNKPTVPDNNHDRRQKQLSSGGPFITGKQYNTSSMIHRSNYCYPTLTTTEETQPSQLSSTPNNLVNNPVTTAIPIPRKSSQRRKRSSPPPPPLPSIIPLQSCQEPVRGSSLNSSIWRSQQQQQQQQAHNNSNNKTYSIPVSVIDSNTLPSPPVLTDKSEKRTSTISSMMSKRNSNSSRPKTTHSLTKINTIRSGGIINHDEDICLSPTSSTLSYDSLPTTIKTVKIDPDIILNYPEAKIVVPNEDIVNSFNNGNIMLSTPI
ncbi:uncharacterized protein BX663DRAFT_488966 [Cokeromyces recurvatus]|uniref:uncharacterized protein n=1 Tax=Cokeromyces recurvatus TaxID=90255 RepID=UPI0022210049|nr:uncharacterized protein BX663DRAFT_488966 [Cokeromyces recurvatus]KAI7899733.1 hypothetical protein BX663DRAFT_488966 [Cokeromyces recurvatus]